MTAFSATDVLLKTTSRLFHLSRCGACRTLFLDPPPSAAEIPTFYPDRYWWTASPNALTRLETVYRRLALRDHISFIERAASRVHAKTSSVRLLDVGCGPGTLIGYSEGQGVRRAGPGPVDAGRRHCGPGDWRASRRRDTGRRWFSRCVFRYRDVVPRARARARSPCRSARGGPRSAPGRTCGAAGSQHRQLAVASLGARWWGLHVPRHIVDYSALSIQILLESTGFVVKRVRHFNQRDNAPALASSLCPALDPQVRAMRQHRIGGRESAAGSWIRHALYLALVGAALPFAVTEAAAGAGATVMVEAAKA